MMSLDLADIQSFHFPLFFFFHRLHALFSPRLFPKAHLINCQHAGEVPPLSTHLLLSLEITRKIH